jgi:cytochrome P450
MGHLPDLKTRKSRSPNKNLAQLMAEYYFDHHWDMLRLSFFKENILFCVDINVVPKILTDPVNFPKSPFMLDAQARINKACGEKLGGNFTLLMMPGGEIWHAKRRILDPAFKKSFLKTTMLGMNKVVCNLMDALVDKTDGRVFDIAVDLNRTAMEAVSVCGFDWNQKLIQEHGQKALDLASVYVEILAVAIKQPFEFSLPWNNKVIKERFKNAALSVRDAMKIHLEKRIGYDSSGDILSHIIRSNDCSDDLDINDLIDEYVIFLVAGMETTAITMATVVQFLTNNPVECQKVQDEIDVVFEGKEELDYDDVTKLKYLENVIKESLRMKGPVFGTWRFCQNDNVIINGVCFPKDARVYIPFEVLQNDARYWENPSVFNPDRFSGDSGRNIRPFTYMPFSAGLRNCIGKNFAMLEMKVVLSNILNRFNFSNPYPEQKNPPRMGNLTMRPLNGVPVSIFNR